MQRRHTWQAAKHQLWHCCRYNLTDTMSKRGTAADTTRGPLTVMTGHHTSVQHQVISRSWQGNTVYSIRHVQTDVHGTMSKGLNLHSSRHTDGQHSCSKHCPAWQGACHTNKVVCVMPSTTAQSTDLLATSSRSTVKYVAHHYQAPHCRSYTHSLYRQLDTKA